MFHHAGRSFSEICVYQEKGATWGKGAATLVHTQGWPAGISELSQQHWLSRGLLVCFTTPQFALLRNGSGAAKLFHRALLESGAEPVSVVGDRDRAEVALMLFWHRLGILLNTCENKVEKEHLWGQCSSAVEVLRVASSRYLAKEFLFSPICWEPGRDTSSLGHPFVITAAWRAEPCRICPLCSLILSGLLSLPQASPWLALLERLIYTGKMEGFLGQS